VNKVSNYESYEIKISRSRFLVHLCYVEELQEAKDFISKISKAHPTANHNCWAYAVGKQGEYAHSSDNGEPSGTAGKPMLNVLLKHKLTNIVAVITRYFGGVKLGIRGLIDAYGGTLDEAILLNGIEELVDYKKLEITTSYGFKDILAHRLGKFELASIETTYASDVNVTISIKETLLDELKQYLDELQNAGKISFKQIKE